jgi:hypothetical protein
MDIKSSVENLDVLNFASPLLRRKEYSSAITHFPGSLCFKPYGLTGDFKLTQRVYVKGKLIASFHSNQVNEHGVIQIDLEDVTSMLDGDEEGLILNEYYHTKDVPIELYISHFNKKTLSYLSYPGLAYMGETIFPEFHARLMESTQFWPGVLSDEISSCSVMLLNPYDLPYSVQFSLILPDGQRVINDPRKIPAKHTRTFDVDDMFPNHLEFLRTNKGLSAICVTGQYKIAAYGIIRSRISGDITTIDHLHTYNT